MSEQQADERTTWEVYTGSWKAPTEEEKRALFIESLTPDCVYADPITRTEGWEELTAYMLDFHQQVPGGHFVTRRFQMHHGACLAHWDMVAGDGTVLGDGISHGRFAPDGRLAAMTGFFDVPDH